MSQNNTSVGHRKLLALLKKGPCPPQIVCEASGGYERQVVAQLQGAQIPVSVINPSRSHAFAKVLGQRAKTDPLDARLLSLCDQSRPRLAPMSNASLLNWCHAQA
jgi:transposase